MFTVTAVTAATGAGTPKEKMALPCASYQAVLRACACVRVAACVVNTTPHAYLIVQLASFTQPHSIAFHAVNKSREA